jgi:hypothetical protein
MQGVEEVVAPPMAEVAVGRPNLVVRGGVSTRGTMCRALVPGTGLMLLPRHACRGAGHVGFPCRASATATDAGHGCRLLTTDQYHDPVLSPAIDFV